MRPLHLSMTAFGPYGGTEEVDFEELGSSGIYLITGPTGAGKTTIFDAICFALYGKMSSKSREPNDFQSQHRQDDAPTEVVLRFEVHGREYTVTRSFKRTKSRGSDGFRFDKKQLVELQQPEEAPITKVDDVNKRIEEILGIGFEQFTKIVMLAQGEFRKFLDADTKERSKIFSEIFDTSSYQHITGELQRSFFDARDAAHDEETRTIENLRGAKTAGSAHETEFKQALERGIYSAGTAIDTLQQVVDEDAAAQGALEKELEDIKAQSSALSGRINTAETLANAQNRKNAAEKDRREAEEQLPKLEQEVERQKALEPERRALADRIAVMRSGLDEYDELDSLKSRLADAESTKRRADRTAAAAQCSLASAQEALDTTKGRLKELEGAADELRTCEKRVGALESAVASLSQVETACTNVLTARKTYKKYQSAYETAQKKSLAASREASRLEQAYLGAQAGLLAQQLEPGEPCPVCGALEHPHPAEVPEEAPSKENWEAAKKERDRCSQAAGDASEKAGAAQGAYRARKEALFEQLASMQDKVRALAGILAEAGWGAGFDASELLALHLGEPGSGAEITAAQVDEVKGTCSAARKTLQDRLDQENERKDALDLDVQEATELRSTQTKQEHALETARSKNEAATAALQEAESACKHLQSNLDEKKAGLEFESKAAAQQTIEQKQARLKKMEKDAEAADAALTDCRMAIKAAAASIAENEKALEGRTIEDAESLKVQNEQLDELQKQRDAEKTELATRLSSNKDAIKQAKETLGRFSMLDEQRTALESLYNTASGRVKGSSRIALETYVQTVFFDQMLVLANERLKAMSGGRYEFVRSTEGGGGVQHGLDIDVRDNYSGRNRPTSTLSGGESFLASMSLALGLSDTVQNNAGGVQLDCMFIDEGFGSLDENLLDTVVEVLKQLSSDNKLVGIISHVGDLQQAIPNKIVVEKSEHGPGSHVHLELA